MAVRDLGTAKVNMEFMASTLVKACVAGFAQNVSRFLHAHPMPVIRFDPFERSIKDLLNATLAYGTTMAINPSSECALIKRSFAVQHYVDSDWKRVRKLYTR